MLHFNRDILARLNYWLVGILMVVSLFIVIYAVSPEKMITGEWEEVGWYFEKPDSHHNAYSTSLDQKIRDEIMDKLDILHMDRWVFQEDGSLLVDPNTEAATAQMAWSIKGRGHILEIRRDGQAIESFLIQELNKDMMELHLNLDIQVKGIIKIVLERQKEELHAEKI